YVAQQFQNTFSDPITIRGTIGTYADAIAVGIAIEPQQEAFAYPNWDVDHELTYFGVRSALAARATTANDATAIASLNPTTDPTGGATFVLNVAQSQLLGFLPANSPPVNAGAIYFDSTLPYTFDPNNRAVAGKIDFIAGAEHELSELMGR